MSFNPHAPSSLTAASPEYIRVVATAKLVRVALARAFPGQKFSVRSSTYAGGAAISIHYTGGPASCAVEAITAPYCGEEFDGMIDLKFSKFSWLAPDGSATRAYSAGTLGSLGTASPEYADPHAAGCRYVHFEADFIHVTRHITDAEYWGQIDQFETSTKICVRHDSDCRTDDARKCFRLYQFERRANGRDVSLAEIFEAHRAHFHPRSDRIPLSEVESRERALGGFCNHI